MAGIKVQEDFLGLNLKTVYRTGDDDLYHGFYRPVLERSVRYDRAVGFFSSEILSINLKGLSQILRNKGKMRLIIGNPLTDDEYKAIRNHENNIVDDYIDRLITMIDDEEKYPRLQILSYLLYSGSLEIKFALRRQGMYHEKIGIAYDKSNNCIVFQGSANETPSALMESLNSECLSVYKSWDNQVFSAYGMEYVKAFDNLWLDRQRDTIVLDVLSKHYAKIHQSIQNKSKERRKAIDIDKIRQELVAQEDMSEITIENRNTPTLPKYINNSKFSIRNHQQEALRLWAKNDYKGILHHSTGSGKTITSIYAITRLFEEKQKRNQPLICIISVPYIDLAKQWIAELKNFNISPVECFDGKHKWKDSLERNLSLFFAKRLNFLCLLVVNKTLISDDFQHLIRQIPADHLFLIGDECHRHSANGIYHALPDARFRLGLSATPFQDDDDVGQLFPNIAKDRLLSYYEQIVHEYSLEDAILDGVLTPYNYHITPVYLTEEEQLRYDELSEIITKIIVESGGKLSQSEQDRLMINTSERSRLLGRASNKLIKLKEIISKTPVHQRDFSLFYVGEGKSDDENTKVIDEVSKILQEHRWKTAQFIGQTSGLERKEILESFKLGIIQSLVAMKVLDEGIDVPACRTAYILASSKNPRQYVQRRGRVLRKFKGKDRADIYDFVTLPNPSIHSEYAKKLINSEFERIRDFKFLAMNKLEIEQVINELGIRDE